MLGAIKTRQEAANYAPPQNTGSNSLLIYGDAIYGDGLLNSQAPELRW